MGTVLDLADEFFAAVSAGDIDKVADFYTDDVAVWHNWDDHEQPKAENLATLGSIPQRYDSFEYVDVRRTEVEGGFLRQHTIKASRNGKTALVPAVLRVYVDGSKIHRIEEYFDFGQLTSALS